MPTQAELLKREQDRENGVVAPKSKKSTPPAPPSKGSMTGAAKKALMDEYGVKNRFNNQTTDSNQD